MDNLARRNARDDVARVHLLIVDGCELSLRRHSGIFRLRGFSVTTVQSGSGALEECRKGNPDIMLIESRLLDMSGVNAVRLLRKEGISVPIVFVSSLPGFKEAHEAGVVGAQAYVARPFRIARLLQILRGATDSTSNDLFADRLNDKPAIEETPEDYVAALIEANPAKEWRAAELAARVELSESRLRHRFSQLFGVSLFRYTVTCRLDHLAMLLVETQDGLKSLAPTCGLGGDLRRVRKAFAARFGMTPKAYRNHMRGLFM